MGCVRAIPATWLKRPSNCLHQDSAMAAGMGLLGALTHDPLPGPRHPYLSPCQLPHLHLVSTLLQLHVQSFVMCHASKEHNVTNWRQSKGKRKKQASEGQAWNINRQSQGSDAYGKDMYRGDNHSQVALLPRVASRKSHNVLPLQYLDKTPGRICLPKTVFIS